MMQLTDKIYLKVKEETIYRLIGIRIRKKAEEQDRKKATYINISATIRFSEGLELSRGLLYQIQYTLSSVLPVTRNKDSNAKKNEMTPIIGKKNRK